MVSKLPRAQQLVQVELNPDLPLDWSLAVVSESLSLKSQEA